MKTLSVARAAGLVAFVSAIWLMPVQPALADNKALLEDYWHQYYGNIQLPTESYSFAWERVAKARVDECFYGVGDSRNRPSFNASYPNDLTDEQVQECIDTGGKPKVNQAYVWGLAKTANEVWFGTVANTLCLVFGGFYDPAPPPMANNSWVCEMGSFLDLRPPRIFHYNIATAALVDRTQVVLDAGPPHNTRLLGTTGLRSAGAIGEVVFLGGISRGGVNLFAFNVHTGEFLGSQQYAQYNNIRQWRVIRGRLYTGFGKAGGGEVARWTGSLEDPFRFETVGNLLGDPAYLVTFKDRIFVSTWGGPEGSGGAVLYMSPLLGSDLRLTAADADGWQVVWRLSDYEVEPAAFQVGGALESHGGYLYWGTMHVPGTGVQAFARLYGEPAGPVESVAAFLGTYRPIAIFRAKEFGTEHSHVQLLYGTSLLPKYDRERGLWTIVPNNMHEEPRYGLAGINNFFNNYTWAMLHYRSKLFVGTMDWLYLGGRMLESMGVDIPDDFQQWAQQFDGADLHAFIGVHDPAVAVSLNGLGNHLNYGIRTMVAGDCLWIGTANPMNLATGSGQLDGGWELYKFGDSIYCDMTE